MALRPRVCVTLAVLSSFLSTCPASADVEVACVAWDESTRSCFSSAVEVETPAVDVAPACGDFTHDGMVTASDALGILKTAVGTSQCLPCICDLDMSNTITATDALIALRFAVRLLTELTCQADGSPVAWTGLGDGLSWSDPANWDLQTRTPNLCDAVTIAAGSQVTVVQATQANFAASVDSSFPIELQSASLRVRGAIDSTEPLTFSGGTLIDATVNAPSIVTSGAGGTFDHVSIHAPIAFSGISHIDVFNDLVLDDTVTFDNGNISFRLDQTLSGTGQFVFATNGSIRTEDNTVLTIEPGIMIHGATGSVGADGASNAIVNKGTIASDAPGTITIEGRMGWTNEGSLSASNGGSLTLRSTLTNTGTIEITGGGILQIEGAWVNQGTISMTDSTVRLAGTFNTTSLGSLQRTGGQIEITGTLDNAAGLLLDAGTGSWVLAGGRIAGGSVTATEGATLDFTSAGGFLAGVTLETPTTVASGTRFRVQNNMFLNAPLTIHPSGSVEFDSGNHGIVGSTEVIFPGPGSSGFLFPLDGCSFVIGAGVTVHGRDGYIGSDSGSASVTNQGIVDSDAGGLIQMRSRAAAGVNTGVLRASDGSIGLIESWVSSGSIEVSTGGAVTTNANLTLSSGSTISTDIGALDAFGTVTVAGAVILDGELAIHLVDGFEPNLGDTFAIVQYASRTGTFTSLTGEVIGNGKMFQASYGPTQLTLEVVAQ